MEGYGYIIAVSWVAIATFFALFAPARPRFLARVSFWLGMVINEIPVVAVILIALSTWLAILDGSLWSPIGQIGGLISLITVGGLGILILRGVKTRKVLYKAFLELKHDEWAMKIWQMGSLKRTMMNLFGPFYQTIPGVEKIKNLAYGTHEKQKLDLYFKPDPPKQLPVLVYFHGGGFSSGRKSKESKWMMYRMAKAGWICISANYRLRPIAGFQEHQEDFRKVLEWVGQNADTFNMDISRITLAGSSAGSHLVSIGSLAEAEFIANRGINICLVVCLYGYYGNYFGLIPGDVPGTKPSDYITSEAPPFLIIHGEQDTFVHAKHARSFADSLRNRSKNEVTFIGLPGAQHNFDLFRSPRYDAVVDAVQVYGDGCRQMEL